MTSVNLKDPAVKRSLRREQAALEHLYHLAEQLAELRKSPFEEALEELRADPVPGMFELYKQLSPKWRDWLFEKIIEYNRKNGPKFEAGDPRKWSRT